MSNFGQSSLDNTKVGAFREHEDSGRGKCFMPGLIRADRNYKGPLLHKEMMKKEERKEKTSVGPECCVVLVPACQCLFK